MEKIKNLGTKIINGRLESFGLFLCPYCLQEVERQLSNGKRDKSCGCIKIKHNGCNIRLYKIWQDIKNRCFNPNVENFQYYGGRGIMICNEWLEFTPFRDWALNNGYQENLTIDRINNNGNYEPNNCRWVTNLENQRKKRNVKLNIEKVEEIRIKYNNGDSIKNLSKKYNINYRTLYDVINKITWHNLKGE